MDLFIRPVLPEDLAEITCIEREIEPDNPADIGVLQARLTMFQDGFLTAWQDGRLIGYAESCIWNEKKPRFSQEKDFFGRKHTSTGETLYIIFIGVRPRYQRRGVGSRLLQALLDLARISGQRRVQAVTWDHLRKFYTAQGFTPVVKMPNFLPEGEFTLLEYRLEGVGTI